MPKVIEIEKHDGDPAYLIEGHVTNPEVVELIAPLEASASGEELSEFSDLIGSHSWYRLWEWDKMTDEEREEHPEARRYSDYYEHCEEGEPGAVPMTWVDPTL